MRIEKHHLKHLIYVFYVYCCRYSNGCCIGNGIPTRGQSWIQFKAGYYLFAILFLMFDIETVFLFPWAAVAQKAGLVAVASVTVFLVILVLGLAYAWRKGALEWK